MRTVRQLLTECNDLDRLDAEVLLGEVLGQGRAWLFAHPECGVSEPQAARFESWVERRRAGEPVAYLIGWRDFWTLRLTVSPATLIPRPETELLVERTLALLPESAPSSVLDLGTGSGAIALAIASERPLATVTASDSSAEALAVAAENARRLALETIEFLAGDWYQPVPNRRFDLIVSNPPYIASSDPHLQQDDAAHEPRLALTPGGDGLDAHRQILGGAIEHLNLDGHLLLEHGHDQRDALVKLVSDTGLELGETCDDLAGLPRVLAARYAG